MPRTQLILFGCLTLPDKIAQCLGGFIRNPHCGRRPPPAFGGASGASGSTQDPPTHTESAPQASKETVTLPLGKVFGTFGALFAFAGALDEDFKSFLARHAKSDWGEVDEHDRKANEYALEHGLRVLSAYTLSSGEKISIITEADRRTGAVRRSCCRSGGTVRPIRPIQFGGRSFGGLSIVGYAK